MNVGENSPIDVIVRIRIPHFLGKLEGIKPLFQIWMNNYTAKGYLGLFKGQ